MVNTLQRYVIGLYLHPPKKYPHLVGTRVFKLLVRHKKYFTRTRSPFLFFWFLQRKMSQNIFVPSQSLGFFDTLREVKMVLRPD